jgi:hypothetical protein
MLLVGRRDELLVVEDEGPSIKAATLLLTRIAGTRNTKLLMSKADERGSLLLLLLYITASANQKGRSAKIGNDVLYYAQNGTQYNYLRSTKTVLLTQI